MKRTLLLAAAIAAIAALTPGAAAAAAADSTAFALDLNRRLAGRGNVMTSGYSARQALGMAYLGAAGATREQMGAALRAGPGFADAERALRAELAAPGEAVLKIANAVFLKQDYAVLPSWEERALASFGAAVFRRDFGEKTVGEINEWASENTNGRIPVILQELDPADRLVLLTPSTSRASGSTLSRKRKAPASAAAPAAGRCPRPSAWPGGSPTRRP